MIVRSLCNRCMQPYQLILQASDLELVQQITVEEGRLCPCPRLCGGFINMASGTGFDAVIDQARLREPMTLTGKQLYQAVQGMGLPDEIAKDPEIIASLLKTKKVVDLSIEETQSRIYLHELKLEGGFTLHFTAGPRGAMVLKITKERPDGS